MNLEPVLRAVVAFRTPHLKALLTPDVIRAYQTPPPEPPTPPSAP